jgi:EmrB/QacA subfamily drug resistance transporter
LRADESVPSPAGEERCTVPHRAAFTQRSNRAVALFCAERPGAAVASRRLFGRLTALTTQRPVSEVEQPSSTGTHSPRLIFSIVAVALFMSSVDTTIVATALPAIHHGLRASINWAGWTITIYTLGLVVTLPIAGQISDQFGRRRVFLCGVALFTVASLLCGFANDIYTLILFRALQAIGGGALQPSAAGVVADHFGANRDRAIGLFGTVASGGQIVGPVFGGLLVGYLSWRWVFFVNVPVGVVLLVMIVKFIPESPRLERKKPDIRGLVLLAMFVLAANFGITNLGSRHSTLVDPLFLVPEICSIGLLYLFVQHTRHALEPFIPVRFFRARGFAVMNSLNLMWGICGFGIASLVPLYAEERYHLSALNAGTLLTARGVGAIAVGAIAAFALRRTGYRLPLAFGFTVVAVGTLLMSVAPRWGLSPYAWLSVCAGITGLGNGTANPASRNACLQIAPNEVAAITGLRQMFVFMGITFSVSIVTAILNRSGDAGITQSHILWFAAGFLVFVMVPLVSRVPEHKGAW